MFSMCSKNAWKLHELEGQSTTRHLNSLYLETQKRYSDKSKEISLNNLIQKEVEWGPLYSERITDETAIRICELDFKNKKYGILRNLLQQYIQRRCPYQSPNNCEKTAFVIGVLVSTYVDDPDFEPLSLWQLLTRTFYFHTDKVIRYASNRFWTTLTNEPLSKSFKIKQISLFGEFLYDISTPENSNSPITDIRKHASVVERALIDELWGAVSPKFGILAFIVFRNCGSNMDNGIVHKIFRNEQIYQKVYPEVFAYYGKVVKRIRQIPTVSEHYDLFLRFLCSEVNQISKLIGDRYCLIGETCLKGIHDDVDYLESHKWHHIGCLVFILKNVADIFLFLYNEHNKEFSFGAFRNLPKYLETHRVPKNNIKKRSPTIFKSNGTYHCIEALVFAMSLVMDFLFLVNWQSDDVIRDYVKICQELKEVFERGNSVIMETVKDNALFPFL